MTGLHRDKMQRLKERVYGFYLFIYTERERLKLCTIDYHKKIKNTSKN